MIAAGYRFGNFKPSAETEAAVREVMIAAGVTPPKVVADKAQQILLTPPRPPWSTTAPSRARLSRVRSRPLPCSR